MKWLAGRLSLLSDAQIRDGFRATGFAGADLDTLSRVMQRRIAELGAWRSPSSGSGTVKVLVDTLELEPLGNVA